jgi:hypothetical protein
MAVFDFHGDSEELAAQYDVAIHKVVAVSQGVGKVASTGADLR